MKAYNVSGANGAEHNSGDKMHCEMLGKKCARTFCMAFKHKVVRDKDGCKEMKGYCRHYKKFWKKQE